MLHISHNSINMRGNNEIALQTFNHATTSPNATTGSLPNKYS